MCGIAPTKTKSGTTVIPLGHTLLRGSSDLPGSCDAPSRHVRPISASAEAESGIRTFLPYLVLLRVGFALPPPLLTARCALTAPFHPYRAQPPQRTAGFEGARLQPRRIAARNPALAAAVTRVSSRTPASQCAGVVRRGGMFSVALSVNGPLRAAARTLSGTPLCGVRTFLCKPAQPDWAEAQSVSTSQQRPSGPAANNDNYRWSSGWLVIRCVSYGL